MKVLVVEDERRLGEFIQKSLTEQRHTATWVRTCREASDALAETPYDAIVLDLTLPDGDGIDLLKSWRKGLDVGADDYMPKPFSLEELLARMRSLLRRQSTQKQTVLEHSGIRLDLLGHTVQVNGKPIDLTSREYALLEIFMQNHGRVLPRTLITDKIWASSYDVDTNLLDVYMSRLRAKLEKPADKPLFKTVRGVGYQLL